MKFQVIISLVAIIAVSLSSSTENNDISVEDPKQTPAQLKASQELNAETSTDIQAWGECSNGWHLYKGNCYNWSGKDNKENWFQSDLNCHKAGGYLVSIESTEESSVLRGLTFCKNDYWIGLVNTDYENSLFVKQEGWSWWDLLPHNFTRLTIANTAGLDCSFARDDGSWSNSYCSHIKRSWVCKQNMDADFQASTIGPNVCPNGWVYYKKNCYKFSKTTANYFHAQLHCAQDNAHVASIDNDHEQAFLQAVNGCDNAFWIGLQEAKPCLSNSSLDRCWEWSNMKPVKYFNWADKNPSLLNNIECTHSQGYWSNGTPCHTKLHYVCKKATS